MDLEISHIWKAIKQRWWIILLSVFVVGALTAWISFYVFKPVYEGTTKILIQTQTASNQIIYNDLLTNQKLVKTYSEIIKSNRVSEEVIHRLNLSITPEELLKKVTTKSNEESLITSITVQDYSPQGAVDIANAYAQAFYEIVNSVMQVDNVSMLDIAKLPPDPQPVFPKPFVNISISIFLTLVICIILILLYESIDKRIKSEEDLLRELELPVLGSISHLGKIGNWRGSKMERNRRLNDSKRGQMKQLVCIDEPNSIEAEAFRRLRTNIRYSGVSKELKSLIITSAYSGEGKSTTIANLAIVMIQAGKKVLLIDADLRKPTIHHFFRIRNNIGLTNILIKQLEVQEVIQEVEGIGLHVISTGPLPPNPAELLGSHEMIELLEYGTHQYDLVLIDVPPILSLSDGQVIARHIEGALLVVRSNKVPKDNVKKAKQLLEHVGANIIGTIINDVKIKSKPKEEYYY